MVMFEAHGFAPVGFFVILMSMGTRIADAWNGWYHLNGNTYGTWIRGDEQGWRARHHREHVEGDYKSPPPADAHVAQRRLSRRLMGKPVRLSPEARMIACDTIVEWLRHQQIEVIACAVDDHHFHVLARFVLPVEIPTAACWVNDTKNQPIYAFIRHTLGLAKSRSARALSGAGLVPEGGAWSKRFKITAIADREHQVTAFRYILGHGQRRAATWSIRPDSQRSDRQPRNSMR